MDMTIQNYEQKQALDGVTNVWTIAIIVNLVVTISNFLWPKKKK